MKFALCLLISITCFWQGIGFMMGYNSIGRMVSKRRSEPLTSSPYFEEVKRQSEKFYREEYWCSRSLEKIKDMSINGYFRQAHYSANDVLIVEEQLEAQLAFMDDLKRERIFKQEELAHYPEHQIDCLWGCEYEQTATYKTYWDPDRLNRFITRFRIFVDYFTFEEARRVLGGGGPTFVAAFAARVMHQFRNPIHKDSTVSYKSELDGTKVTVSVLSPDHTRMVKLEVVPDGYLTDPTSLGRTIDISEAERSIVDDDDGD